MAITVLDKKSATPVSSIYSSSSGMVGQAHTTPKQERAPSPMKLFHQEKSPDARLGMFEFADDDMPSESPTKSPGTRSAMKQTPSSGQSINKALPALPAPINIEATRIYAKQSAQRKYGQGMTAQRAPEMSVTMPNICQDDAVLSERSSTYSQDFLDRRLPGHVSPLRIKKSGNAPLKKSVTIHEVDERRDKEHSVPGLITQSPALEDPFVKYVVPDNDAIGQVSSAGIGGVDTPITPFINEGVKLGVAGDRKASKTLIGHNGWLDDTSHPIVKAPSPTRKAGFFGDFVKKAKEIIVS